MLKKTITYENLFTDEKVTEDHWFHISKADLVEMELEEHGQRYVGPDGQELTGMQAKLQRIVDSEDGKAIMAELKDIIRRSYGRREGNRFIKTKENWEDFSSSEAFSELFWELCTDAKAAGDFIAGLVPGNLEQIAAEVRAIAEREEASSGSDFSDAPALDTESSVPAVAAFDAAAAKLGATTTADIAAPPAEPRVLSTPEVLEMDAQELKHGIAIGKYKLS